MEKPKLSMKKLKLTTICSLIITIYLLSSFIFIHADPVRVARRYILCQEFVYTLKETAELEYTSDDKRNVSIRISSGDNSISGMHLYKTKSGLWFIIPNSVYSF
ncbi:hypothetical protein [Clostridium sp.]|uniref:hypothetical protein n=1 Tax=Clostridium sp. TaxID=1506 RepID=UPI00321720B9